MNLPDWIGLAKRSVEERGDTHLAPGLTAFWDDAVEEQVLLDGLRAIVGEPIHARLACAALLLDQATYAASEQARAGVEAVVLGLVRNVAAELARRVDEHVRAGRLPSVANGGPR